VGVGRRAGSRDRAAARGGARRAGGVGVGARARVISAPALLLLHLLLVALDASTSCPPARPPVKTLRPAAAAGQVASRGPIEPTTICIRQFCSCLVYQADSVSARKNQTVKFIIEIDKGFTRWLLLLMLRYILLHDHLILSTPTNSHR
jgi:hypothetical protein